MNAQIRWITGLLEANSIPYWVDGGTLLGLMREGDLLKLPDDLDDIDIGIWSQYEPRIRRLVPLLQKAGYAIRVYTYKHLIYKFKFLPHPDRFVPRSRHIIDINIYRKYGEYAWCPESFPKFTAAIHSSSGFGSIRYHFTHLMRRTHLPKALSYLMFGSSQSQVPFITRWFTIDVSALPWAAFIDVGSWLIPRFYFDDISRVRDFDVLAPRDWESYLQLRYGDWKTRVEEWQYWQDDGAFQRKPPHEIIKTVTETGRTQRACPTPNNPRLPSQQRKCWFCS